MPVESPQMTPPPGRAAARALGRFRPGPALLVTSPLAFAAAVALTLIAVSASGVPMMSDASSAQFDETLALFVIRGAVFLLAFVWGGLGVAVVARRLLTDPWNPGGREGPEPIPTMTVGGLTWALGLAALIAVALSVVAGLAQAILPLFASGFSEPTFGDTWVFGAYYAASLLACELAVVAVGLVSLAVRAAGLRPRFTTVLALVSLAYVVVDLTTRGGVPPFGVAFLWLALGVGLRASRVSA